MPACVTAISTSRGPIVGIGAARSRVKPGAGLVFFKATIVAFPVDFRSAGALGVAVGGIGIISYLSNRRSCILDAKLQFARFGFQYNGLRRADPCSCRKACHPESYSAKDLASHGGLDASRS